MNYKKELLKKLFKKLGKEVTEKDEKGKSLRLATNISVHDLENKKKKAIEFLKKHTNLTIFMKVNIYDDENIEKGKLILANLAEDLKEYSKIVVQKNKPSSEDGSRNVDKPTNIKKPEKLDDIKKMQDN